MSGRGATGGRRVLLPPINFLFRLLQQRSTVQIWLYEQLSIRIIGTIRVRARRETRLSFSLAVAAILTRLFLFFFWKGFDEFMNLVVSTRGWAPRVPRPRRPG